MEWNTLPVEDYKIACKRSRDIQYTLVSDESYSCTEDFRNSDMFKYELDTMTILLHGYKNNDGEYFNVAIKAVKKKPSSEYDTMRMLKDYGIDSIVG